MAGRPISRGTILLAVLLAAMQGSKVEERLCGASNPAGQLAPADPCIRTDRLSRKQLRTWRAIEAIVFARDASGSLEHPRLHSLWRSVATGGNVLHVELLSSAAFSDREAGKFIIEKSGAGRHENIAVIRLCLPVIDEALVSERAQGSDGFIRFKGLRGKERYAEILGHELAHAVWTLGDQSHARLLQELNALAEEFERSHRHGLHGADVEGPERQHLQRLKYLMTVIEEPAVMAEAEIWKELLRSRKNRKIGKSGSDPENAISRIE